MTAVLTASIKPISWAKDNDVFKGTSVTKSPSIESKKEYLKDRIDASRGLHHKNTMKKPQKSSRIEAKLDMQGSSLRLAVH